jgi:hypothetical protein
MASFPFINCRLLISISLYGRSGCNVTVHLDADIWTHGCADATSGASFGVNERCRVETATIHVFCRSDAMSRAKIDTEHAGFAAFSIDSNISHGYMSCFNLIVARICPELKYPSRKGRKDFLGLYFTASSVIMKTI